MSHFPGLLCLNGLGVLQSLHCMCKAETLPSARAGQMERNCGLPVTSGMDFPADFVFVWVWDDIKTYFRRQRNSSGAKYGTSLFPERANNFLPH